LTKKGGIQTIKKIKDLLHNWIFWLILITVAAIVIRSIPAWTSAAWGCDFGIYFGITKSVATNGELFPKYTGWGSSYNYFPVLYAINVLAHWITGVDVSILMPKLTPVFGGLSVLIFYFIVYELLKNRKISLISSAILAVLPFHVYQTSHASPLTMGHFFMILSLYFFIKYREKNYYIFPLIGSTILLVMSHHLTTYFYIITLVFIVFFENATIDRWAKTIKKDVIYVLFTSCFAFSYWFFIATPVFYNFMTNGLSIDGLRISSFFVVVLFFILFFLSFVIAKVIRKITVFLLNLKIVDKKKSALFIKFLLKLNPFIKKPEPSIRSRVRLFLVSIMLFLGLLFYFTFIPLPWTGFSFTIRTDILTIPLLMVFAFAIIGFGYTCYLKNGFLIRGWFFAILSSLAFALLTRNTTLFPDRHFEYLMYPLAILATMGIGSFFSDPYFKVLFSKLKNKKKLVLKYKGKSIHINHKLRVVNAVFMVSLMVSLALSVYPSFEALDQAWEEISQEDMNTIEWAGLNLDKNTTVIASDHRLERLAEADGLNTTKDETFKLWFSENLSDYVDELYGVGKNYSRVTHIIIDDTMKNEGVHTGPHNGIPTTVYMTNETWTAAYDKFKKQPFELIYRNESMDLDQLTGEPKHWTEIYKINWSYLELFNYTI